MKKAIRAFVVDGAKNDCEVIVCRLSELGHDCDIVHELETAKDLFSKFKYDYVILNIEIPRKHGEASSIENSKELLTLIRTRYDRYELPVIISIPVSSRNEGICAMWSHCCRKEITAVYDKASLYEPGKHSLEKAVAIVSENIERYSRLETDDIGWLSHSLDPKDRNYMIWSTVSQSGRERIYRIKSGTIRARLLICIWKFLHEGSVVSYSDLFEQGGSWTYNEFYTKSNDAYHGRLRSHVDVFKRRLGMRVDYIRNVGLKIEQPLN